jgi:hypothetical protein
MRGLHPQAEVAMREALAIRRRLVPVSDLDTARLLSEMVWPLQQNSHPAEAIAVAREALAIRMALHGDYHELANSLASLSHALATGGDLPAAEEAACQARDLLQQNGQGESHSMALVLIQLGKIELERGNPVVFRTSDYSIPEEVVKKQKDGARVAAGEADLRQALVLMTAVAGRESVKTAAVLLPLSQGLIVQGRLEEAETLARELVSTMEAKQEPSHAGQETALRLHESILRKLGNYAAAEPVARKIVAWNERKYGLRDERVVRARQRVVGVLELAGKSREAEEESAAIAALRKAGTDLPVAR